MKTKTNHHIKVIYRESPSYPRKYLRELRKLNLINKKRQITSFGRSDVGMKKRWNASSLIV
jgi:hypothetical protein